MQKDIDDLLAVWAGAERTGDTATLDTLLADDFVGIGPVGFVLDKAAWLSRFELGLRYDDLGLDEVSVHRHAGATFVVARQHAVGSHAGNPIPPDTRLAFTILDDDRRPQVAAMQYSFIGPPLGAPR